MDFPSDKKTFYGPSEYLPNFTPDFINVIPKLYNVDIQVYFVLAANIVDHINCKTIPITPKEISEKLPDKSRPSVRNALHRLKSTTLPFSGKPMVIQEQDTYILPDSQHASMIQNLQEQA